MRRKSDMWHDVNDQMSFLPGEGEQAAQTAAADVRERLVTLEGQLKSQFTSMAAYAQIAQEAVGVARAEARADLDREKATIVTLVERVHNELLGEAPRHPLAPLAPLAPPAAPQPSVDISTLARLALLEDKFEQMSQQFTQVMRSQEELANSIAMMFEQQMRSAGWLANCGEAAAR